MEINPFLFSRYFVDQTILKFGSGQSVERVEDAHLLIGAGQFADDIEHASQLHLAFVRSSQAHALIESIDTRAAQNMPGVKWVLTGAMLEEAGVKPMAKPVNFKKADGSPIHPPQGPSWQRIRFALWVKSLRQWLLIRSSMQKMLLKR
jgi:carbon-monoxide dehydrogenase large subunit